MARFRPQNKIEIASGGEPIVDFNSEDTCTIQVGYTLTGRSGLLEADEVADTTVRIVQRGRRGLHLRPRIRHGLTAG